MARYRIMSRYYFSLENGHAVRDEDGEECPDDAAARAMAAQTARELAKNNTNNKRRRVVVRSEGGKIVCDIRIKG